MESIKIVILLFDGLTALDAVGPYEVLSRIPNSKVYFVSGGTEFVSCTGGLHIVSDYSIYEITEADILVIPGGFGVDKLLNNTEILNWIKKIHEKTKFTTSVCTGSLLLGAAGILRNLKATTHWNHIEKLKKYDAEPVKERYVIEGKIITSAGVSAGIDMSLKLVQLIGSESLSKLIQLSMEYDPAPPFDAGSPEKISKELLALFHSANTQRNNA